MEEIFWRTPYNHDSAAFSDEFSIKDFGASMTVQSMKDDADINVLMERFGITGKMPDNPRVPQYADFTEITDFRSALDAVRNAQEMFMEMPANVRARFENDPQKVLEFFADEKNIDEAESLGLFSQEAVRRRAAEKAAKIAAQAEADAARAAKTAKP